MSNRLAGLQPWAPFLAGTRTLLAVGGGVLVVVSFWFPIGAHWAVGLIACVLIVAAVICWLVGRRDAESTRAVQGIAGCIVGFCVLLGIHFLGLGAPGTTPFPAEHNPLGFGVLALMGAAFIDVLAQHLPERPTWRSLGRPTAWGGMVAAGLSLALLSQHALAGLGTGDMLAPDGEGLPLPTAIAGEVAWQVSMRPPDSIQIGARGPILGYRDKTVGINSADGSTLWEVHHPCRSESGAHPRSLLVSLSREYVVTPAKCGEAIRILNTRTGQIMVERDVNRHTEVQLTDEVAWVGREGVEIATGETIWDRDDSPRASFTAGHRCFFSRPENSNGVAETFSDQDPADTKLLEKSLGAGAVWLATSFHKGRPHSAGIARAGPC
ncbi:MAG: hypothetical protein Q4D79_07520 [Propionibacteriaceae bacterium]|nr:hypothetical protein [Propionibacteriaceae bacterium]